MFADPSDRKMFVQQKVQAKKYMILKLVFSTAGAPVGKTVQAVSTPLHSPIHPVTHFAPKPNKAIEPISYAQCVLCQVRCHCIFSGPGIRYSDIFCVPCIR